VPRLLRKLLQYLHDVRREWLARRGMGAGLCGGANARNGHGDVGSGEAETDRHLGQRTAEAGCHCGNLPYRRHQRSQCIGGQDTSAQIRFGKGGAFIEGVSRCWYNVR
jgi:hypothetical protein